MYRIKLTDIKPEVSQGAVLSERNPLIFCFNILDEDVKILETSYGSSSGDFVVNIPDKADALLERDVNDRIKKEGLLFQEIEFKNGGDLYIYTLLATLVYKPLKMIEGSGKNHLFYISERPGKEGFGVIDIQNSTKFETIAKLELKLGCKVYPIETSDKNYFVSMYLEKHTPNLSLLKFI